MMHEFFDSLVTGLEAKLEQPDLAHIARKRFALETARLGRKLFDDQTKVAWGGVVAPFDLLNAMGVTSCYVEFVGAMLAGKSIVEPSLEHAEERGMSTDCCSYHRSVLGATWQGMMPEPDFLLATTAPCSGGLAVLENLARHFHKPLHVIHIPSNRNEAAVPRLADELRAAAEFVGEQTGEPLDMDRLSAAVEASNRARRYLDEAIKLSRAVPTPARRKDMVNLGIVLSLFFGTEGGVEVARAYRDEFKRVMEARAGDDADPPRERARLIWLQNRIQFPEPLLDMIYDDLGAAVVMDEFNDMDWEDIDPADPFTGMARRIMSICLVAGTDLRIQRLHRLCEEFEIDGAINPCQWGCRQGSGTRGLVQQGLTEVGVPVLNLEVDCIDPRSFAPGQLRTRLEAFVEMIEGRSTPAVHSGPT